tara:strand:- start:28189 stop:28554 length:366 start_codon:yes stop_codon:yes gene_type:complete
MTYSSDTQNDLAWYRDHSVTTQPHCPNCGSHHIEQKNHGRRTGGALGSIAAALGTFHSAGFNPIKDSGLPVSTSPTAILGALAGVIAGCAAGAALGQTVDETLLDNYRCLRCDYSFQTPNR